MASIVNSNESGLEKEKSGFEQTLEGAQEWPPKTVKVSEFSIDSKEDKKDDF